MTDPTESELESETETGPGPETVTLGTGSETGTQTGSGSETGTLGTGTLGTDTQIVSMTGGSPASDRVDAYANGKQDLDVDNVVSPRFENTYKTTGGGKQSTKKAKKSTKKAKKSTKKSKKSFKKGKKSCKKCVCTDGCGCGCTAKKCVCKGKCKCNKKGGAKKSYKKKMTSGEKGKKSYKKEMTSGKKGKKSVKKGKKSGEKAKHHTGGGSDWISTVYSRGPSNIESNLERDALFTSQSNLVSNEELRNEGNKSTMYV